MRLDDDRLTFSPSDLSGFLACEHLTALQVLVARGAIQKPYRVNPHADLIRRKGQEHERSYLDALGASVTRIDPPWELGWARAAHETAEAMGAGASIVYQAAFVEGDWRGLADFVERQPDGSYEAVDTKLARHARPQHVLQLCFYSEGIAGVQGRLPRAMHVVPATGERETFRVDDFLAYYRRVRSRFRRAVATGRETYPWPVEHCALCDFLSRCVAQRERDDHLSLVASIRRSQIERLRTAGIATLAALGRATSESRPKGMRQPVFEVLHEQAALQLHERETQEQRWEALPREQDRGFALLPEPDEGDVYLDLEGDPYYEPARGLDYLFGVVSREGGRLVYRAIRGGDRSGEKVAFEELVGFLADRRRVHPGMHVYHYNHYERTALSRLMGEHGTCEQEIDDLLRGEVLVDLYQVVRQALRISKPSYSLKQVEKLYGFARTADVRSGGESAVLFEEWLDVGDDSLLAEIERYNEEDCRSTEALHRWLVDKRALDLPWRLPPERREQAEATKERLGRHAELRGRVLHDAEDGDPRWLLGQLLEYHRREEKPAWWEYFHHLRLSEEELIEDGDTIGGITALGEPVLDGRSLAYTLCFPPQEHKIGGDCVDPKTEKRYHVTVDDEHGRISVRRAKRRAEEPLPEALIPPDPLGDYVQRDAVARFAEDYLGRAARYPALAEILERRPPRARLEAGPLEAAVSLDGSYLFVQGPPGSGKTYTGGRMAVELMRRGKRVGVTSRSHKAIHRFLEEVRDAAREVGFSFKGRKKGDGADSYEDEFVECTDDNVHMLDPELQLLAGTAWLFAREGLDQHVDTLFVDEAGQVALADAVAVGTAARNVVLLGDPNQLPQVSQGSHPLGSDASVLEHLLGEDETVKPGMGLFLEQTWRLRPEVNEFVSTTFYEGRLRPAPVALARSLAAGNGIRFVPVEHEGHRQASPAEARAVAEEIERLVGTQYEDEHGRRVLGYEDIVVVAAYNAHVRCLRQNLPEDVRVGTVDKFQGQEAPVSFYSLASSRGEDVPRGLAFLFSRNRLNVAVSRAKCAAYVVASPRLLEARCRTIEDIRLVNALCAFVEAADTPR